MKALINKKTDILLPSGEGVIPVGYSELIKMVCNSMIQGGYSISDIRSRITISSAADKPSGETIELENSDAVYLQNAVKNMRWYFSHKDLITFTDDIEQLGTTKL